MKYVALVVVLVLVWLYNLGTTNAPPTVEHVEWTVTLAERLGNPNPSSDTLKLCTRTRDMTLTFLTRTPWSTGA